MDKWYQLKEGEGVKVPPVELKHIDGRTFMEIPDDDDLINVGFVPAPQTRFGWFLYHLIHGIAMKYPLRKVIGYAIDNTSPEEVVHHLDI